MLCGGLFQVTLCCRFSATGHICNESWIAEEMPLGPQRPTKPDRARAGNPAPDPRGDEDKRAAGRSRIGTGLQLRFLARDCRRSVLRRQQPRHLAGCRWTKLSEASIATESIVRHRCYAIELSRPVKPNRELGRSLQSTRLLADDPPLSELGVREQIHLTRIGT